MDTDENTSSHKKRRLMVNATADDVLVRILDIPEADYECVMVNNSWIDKGLIEGDIILFAERNDPVSGDIILIEEEGRTRLGLASSYGFLETSIGRRPIEAAERIIGVGVALARKL